MTSFLRTRWVLVCAVACVMIACAHRGSKTTDADGRLHRLVDDYFEAVLVRNPLIATYIGDSRYNDRLAIDIAPAYRADMLGLHRYYLERVRELDREHLSESARVTLEIFESECNQAIEAARFPSHLLPVDQMGGLPSTFAELGGGENAQPFRNASDYDNFLARSLDFANWIDQAIVNMRDGVRQGVVQPRVVVHKVLEQLAALIVDDPTQSLFYKPIANLPADLSKSDRERLTKAYRDTIVYRIVPAYRRLHDFLRDEYLPKARSSVAFTALPDGQAWYAYLVKHYTTTELTATEIHGIGLAEVARIRGQMRGVQTKLGIAGELEDFFKALENDASQYFTSGEQLLTAHHAVKKNIDAQLPRFFSDFPKADYEIREVEAFRARSAAGAFYQQPSAEGSRPGIFYVNTYNLKAQPKFGITTLSLHEAAPGHHFQISLQQEITDLPRFRRFLVGYTAYVEGWAMYAERLGNEMGLFDDPHQYFGHLNDEMLRAMRLVVDTGLHTLSWTREEAIEYMLKNSYMAPSDAEAEVERYIANPGQALGYKIGQLKIQDLRSQAERALGPRFDVKEFHRQILRDGPLPMNVLAAKIERWVQQ